VSGAAPQIQTHTEHVAHSAVYPSRGSARNAGAWRDLKSYQDAWQVFLFVIFMQKIF
jgi:hypothetical protein